MRLIDADVFKKNMDYICDAGGWLEPVTKAVREFVKRHIDAQTTVNQEPHWIPFEVRELTDEERERYPNWAWILDGDTPEDEQEILVSKGNWITMDTFINEGECYLDGGWEIEKGMAWMPLPEPYREEGGEE